jgi:hypothetical protein
MIKRVALVCVSSAAMLFAQEQSVPSAAQPQGGFKAREIPVGTGSYQVLAGTHILLNMINSVSTRQALVGDRIYLETAFPVISNGRIVVPQGSWVTGTITEVKRPGRLKGRGELQVRFDSLTLPNGVTRDFRSDLGAVDPRDDETLKREQSAVKGPGNKAGDVGTVAQTTTAGTVIGSGIGAAAGNVARGAGLGVGAGAAAGLLGVLMTRGPDATLSKGSTVEMVLDRPITFETSDLDFANAAPGTALSEGVGTQRQSQRQRSTPRLPY